MATLYAFKFNNYYNRRMKRFNNLNDYPEPEYIETGTYCNFNPNDGINTEIILGRPGNNNYEGECDYFIYSDDNVNITSRWFVIEQTRKMGYQYKVLLHRDVIADNLDKILRSECFIEKAILPNNNPLIFNPEGISVNEIKKSEVPLIDESGCAWIIGYLKRDYNGGTINSIPAASMVADFSYSSKNDFYTAIVEGVAENTVINFNDFSVSGNGMGVITMWCSLDRGLIYGYQAWYDYKIIYNCRLGTWRSEQVGAGYVGDTGHYNFIISNLSQLMASLLNCKPNRSVLDSNTTTSDIANYSVSKYNKIANTSGKILNITTGLDAGYYYINTEVGNNSKEYIQDRSSALLAYIETFIGSNKLTGGNSGYSKDLVFSRGVFSTIKYYFSPAPASTTYKITIPDATSRLHLKDAPYDMFLMPFGDISLKNSQGSDTSTFILDKLKVMNFMQGLAEGIGTENIIDLQLVPYTPLTGLIYSSGLIDVNSNDTKRYTYFQNSSNQNVGLIIWATASSSTKNILYTIDNMDNKMSSICDKWRLVSPNYNGAFEFNAAKNNGVLLFNVDFTYLPNSPYIHLNPNFGGLYGADYNDARGLICQGDFSISYLSDRWAEYITQNKNFAEIFNRGIQNMEVSHEWEMKQAYVSAAAGTVSGAVSGAIGGGAFGGVGGIVGGLIGTAAAGVGGALDINMKEALYSEAVDYKKDIFNLQLDNIKALPSSLVKITAYNENNKIFPFLEYYTCTDEEKAAVAKKIAWNSMTVGIIGQIQEYIGNSWSYGDIHDKGYIKARLIRFEDAEEDFHNVNAIADELFKGVYFK